MDLTTIITLCIDAILIPLVIAVYRIANGIKCQHRTEMLRIYYHNKNKKEIRQYEYENFLMLYKSYKALKGNSFIDKIYKEIQTWDVVS